MPSKLLFCVWWVAENGLVCWLMFDFLTGVAQMNGRRHLPVWLAASSLMTLIVLTVHPPGAFLLSVLVPLGLAKFVLRLSGPELIAPMTIILTLCTIKEGCSAFLLSWLSVRVSLPTGGVLVQLLVPAVLDLFLFAALKVIRKRYAPALRQPAVPYLYLLPCTLAILTIRAGLRLDSADFERYLAALALNSRFAVLFSMAGAMAVVFVLMESFRKADCLSEQVRAARNRMNGAGTRQAALQHDLRNHLLVLSGLLRKRQFAQAQQYSKQLQNSLSFWCSDISTGNPALDVLLNEKLSLARDSRIEAACDVSLPEGFGVNDVDLCVLCSNLLDNAITACKELPAEKRFLFLSIKSKAQLLTVEAVNATSASGPIVFGTGLTNVRHVAETYQGTLETELRDGRFRVSVLLCAR